MAIDTNGMTARLLAEYIHPDDYISDSQGSMQLLTMAMPFWVMVVQPPLPNSPPTVRCCAMCSLVHLIETRVKVSAVVLLLAILRTSITGLATLLKIRKSDLPMTAFLLAGTVQRK